MIVENYLFVCKGRLWIAGLTPITNMLGFNLPYKMLKTNNINLVINVACIFLSLLI
jgi:hypothetical protein